MKNAPNIDVTPKPSATQRGENAEAADNKIPHGTVSAVAITFEACRNIGAILQNMKLVLAGWNEICAMLAVNGPAKDDFISEIEDLENRQRMLMRIDALAEESARILQASLENLQKGLDVIDRCALKIHQIKANGTIAGEAQ